jgi:hypothetical protein
VSAVHKTTKKKEKQYDTDDRGGNENSI